MNAKKGSKPSPSTYRGSTLPLLGGGMKENKVQGGKRGEGVRSVPGKLKQKFSEMRKGVQARF